MDFRTIRYEKLGAVLRITANRPEVLNAQSRAMILELDEAFRAASDDDAIRVIIVAGSRARFSSGPPPRPPDWRLRPKGPPGRPPPVPDPHPVARQLLPHRHPLAVVSHPTHAAVAAGC